MLRPNAARLLGAVLALATGTPASNTRAQEAPAMAPPPLLELTPAPTATTTATNGAKVETPAEESTESLQRMQTLYETASKRLGSEHVLLTAAVYLSQDCGKEGDKRCHNVDVGAAGMVSVPLFGAGSGHGADWYPVLQTKDGAEAFARFQAQLKQTVLLADNTDWVAKDPRVALQSLTKAALVLLDQAEDHDGWDWELARATRKCIDAAADRQAARVTAKLDAFSPSADDKALATYSAEAPWVPTAAASEDVDPASKLGAFEKKVAHSIVKTDDLKTRVAAIYTDCAPVLAAIEAGDLKAQYNALRKLLTTYWSKLPKDESVTKRHAFLLGPTIGIPVTENPSDVVLAGALFETGYKWFRMSFTAGAKLRYKSIEETPGWFAGIALSGQLGDDLTHLLNGGLSAARAVSGAP